MYFISLIQIGTFNSKNFHLFLPIESCNANIFITENVFQLFPGFKRQILYQYRYYNRHRYKNYIQNWKYSNLVPRRFWILEKSKFPQYIFFTPRSFSNFATNPIFSNVIYYFSTIQLQSKYREVIFQCIFLLREKFKNF